MTTLIISVAIFIAVVVLFVWYDKRQNNLRQQRNAALFKKLESNPRYQLLVDTAKLMAQSESIDGKVPDAYGEFGYDATNPIPTQGIIGSMAYLAKLRTEDGIKVEYKRLGHTRAENVNHPIDIYEIWVNGDKVCTLYLCPYFRENSAIAPKGFNLVPTDKLFEK